VKLSWVHSHSDKKPWETFSELKRLNLSRDETYNVWCDRMAQKTWETGASSYFDPVVLPTEKWALFSRHPTFHKLTGCFDTGIYSSFRYTTFSDYTYIKNTICLRQKWIK
jgi:hypothetical protein